jgi:hypothetical protein
LTNVEPQNAELPPVDTDGQFDIRKSTFGNLLFRLPATGMLPAIPAHGTNSIY